MNALQRLQADWDALAAAAPHAALPCARPSFASILAGGFALYVLAVIAVLALWVAA